MLGETGLPADTVVIVIVMSDEESRNWWYPWSSRCMDMCRRAGYEGDRGGPKQFELDDDLIIALGKGVAKAETAGL